MRDFIVELKESLKKNWDSIALTDYSGGNVTYGQLYTETLETYKLWKKHGVFPGDKVGILSHNCINWLKVYLTAIMHDYIAILVPENLSAELTNDIIKHSDCRILYTSADNATTINEILPELDIFDIHSLSPIFVADSRKISTTSTNVCKICQEAVCTILYTSGSMGIPKGVMFSYNNITYQVDYISRWMSKYQDSRFHVNFLPFAHIYGLMCDALSSIYMGNQLIILGANNSISNLLSALRKYKPSILLSVPMVINGIFKTIGYQRSINDVSDAELSELRSKILTSLGGGINAILTGGAAISPELESLLIYSLKLPFVSGYGTTECGILSAGTVGEYVCGSCGRLLDPEVARIMKLRNTDKSGEIQINGKNVFAGYYKDAIATASSFTEDGWFKTGDLGYIDKDGNLFITGRCKDMLLTSNGENIYPEESESIMNASPYIKESILVQRGEKIHAIVVPDREKSDVDNLDEVSLDKKIDETVREAGKKLPRFTIISSYELRDEPLERTPKGSVKRFLYSEGIKEN